MPSAWSSPTCCPRPAGASVALGGLTVLAISGYGVRASRRAQRPMRSDLLGLERLRTSMNHERGPRRGRQKPWQARTDATQQRYFRCRGPRISRPVRRAPHPIIAIWGYPSDRTSLYPWTRPGPGSARACPTRGPLGSSRPGSGPMPTACGRYKCAACGKHLGDGRRAVRPQADAADGVVHRLLDVRRAEGRRLRAEPAALAGDRLLPDGVGDAAPAAVGAGAAPGRDRLSGTVEVDETSAAPASPAPSGLPLPREATSSSLPAMHPSRGLSPAGSPRKPGSH